MEEASIMMRRDSIQKLFDGYYYDKRRTVDVSPKGQSSCQATQITTQQDVKKQNPLTKSVIMRPQFRNNKVRAVI